MEGKQKMATAVINQVIDSIDMSEQVLFE